MVIFMLGLASRRWWLSGLSGAAAVLTRLPLAAAIAVAGVRSAWRARSFRPAVVIGLLGLMGTAGLLLYNDLVFGRVTPFVGSYERVAGAYTGTSSTADAWNPLFFFENLAGATVSPARGLLVVTPALALLLPGLVIAWRRADGWVRDAALGGVAVAVVQLATNNFSGGSGFYGYRYTLETLTLLTPLLVISWQAWTARHRWSRWTFTGLALFGVWANVASLLSPPTSDTSTNEAWRHYQLAEALSRASGLDWGILILSVFVIIGACCLGRVMSLGRHAEVAPPTSLRQRRTQWPDLHQRRDDSLR